MSIDIIQEWVTDVNTCFLMAAGCSVCAGKVCMPGLTGIVSANLSDQGKDTLADVKRDDGQKPNVEDLMNFLLNMQRIVQSRQPSKVKKANEWDEGSLTTELKTIRKSIVDAFGSDWQGSQTHIDFLKRLTYQKSRRICDLFTINYDSVIEASLEAAKFPYTDGFRGAQNAFFDVSTFDIGHVPEPTFRLFKMHGSINWVRDEDETVRRIPTNQASDKDRVVIYPAEQKYYETQFGVYESLMGRFRSRLRKEGNNNKLVTLGYSFGDEHINHAIIDAINTPNNNLTVYSFVGPGENINKQEEHLKGLIVGVEDKINILLGQQCFIGRGLSISEWESIKSLDLWKFENLVQHLTRGTK